MSRFPIPVVVVCALVMAGCGQAGATLAPMPAAPEAIAAPALTTAQEGEGRLEIRVSGLGYSVMATTEQVKFIRVIVSGGALTAPKTKEVVAGTTGTIALESIPAGTVTVTIEALDANGFRLGKTATSAAVVKGQTAVVAASLKLDATHVVSEDGNLELDLKVESGEVVVDPIAPASPRPSSPVLTPASPVPSVEPGLRLTGAPDSSWYADGTMSVEGAVKNHFAEAKPVSLKVAFESRGILGFKVVETQTVAIGTLAPLGSKAFSIRSSKKVQGLLGNGRATVTIVTP